MLVPMTENDFVSEQPALFSLCFVYRFNFMRVIVLYRRNSVVAFAVLEVTYQFLLLLAQGWECSKCQHYAVVSLDKLLCLCLSTYM